MNAPQVNTSLMTVSWVALSALWQDSNPLGDRMTALAARSGNTKVMADNSAVSNAVQESLAILHLRKHMKSIAKNAQLRTGKMKLGASSAGSAELVLIRASGGGLAV